MNRSGLNDAASGKLSSESWTSSDAEYQVGVLRNDPLPQANSRLCAPHGGVENRPDALHFRRSWPAAIRIRRRRLPRSAATAALDGGSTAPTPRPMIRRLSRDRRPARSASRRRCADPGSAHRFRSGPAPAAQARRCALPMAGSARASAISESMTASKRRRYRRYRPHGLHGPRSRRMLGGTTR